MLDKKFFNKIKNQVRDKYRKHIFDPKGGGSGAKDVFGKNYPDYTTGYERAKSTGNINVYGKPQDLKFKNSKAPVLTGDLYKSFGVSGLLSNGFGFGTLTEGAKVKRLAQLTKSRVVTTNVMPLPNTVGLFIMMEADKYALGQLNKIKGRTDNV